MSLAVTRLQEEEKEEKRRKFLSAVLTSFILAILLLLLVLFGFKYLDPPPPPPGSVMVSMGQEEGGYTQETPQQTAAEEAASSPKSDESVETQDYEDAPDAKSNPNPSNPNTTPPNDSKKQDKPNETVNSDLLFKQGEKNTDNGNDGKKGNKGKDDGKGTDPLGGTGYGTSGDGNWYMSGRKPETKISASCKFGRSETVVVQIKVDRNGKVIATDCKIKFKKFKATTVGEPYCKCAKQAAKSVRFTPKSDAPSVQVGAVKFDFKVK